jgi:polysaccharide export outer membrane protein
MGTASIRAVVTWAATLATASAGFDGVTSVGPPGGTGLLAAQSLEYVIGPRDVLAVTVFDQESLSGKYTVDLDGTLTFPFVGRVKLAGLTVRRAEAELTKVLADGYFVNPQIAIAVEQYRSQQVFVVGEVRQPGAYPLTGDMTLIEALARAGSTTGPQAATEVLIIRSLGARGPLLPGEDEAAEVIRVGLGDLEAGRPGPSLSLRGGDTIYVPRAGTVYVLGQVRSPGAYPVQPGTTVLQVLSLAGGLTEFGSSSRIRIVRTELGKSVERRARLTDTVQAGDTVVVREKLF